MEGGASDSRSNEPTFSCGLGFGLCGTPDTLIGALAKRNDVDMLTAVSNNVGSGELGLGECLN